MKKYAFLSFSLLLVKFCTAQDTVTMGKNIYVIEGEHICSSEANPWNNEAQEENYINCYVELRSDSIIYSQVMTNNYTGNLKIFRVAIKDLDLKKAKIDWEKEFCAGGPYGIDRRLDIPIKDNLEKVFYTINGQYGTYNGDALKKLKMNFVEEKKAKEFLKKLKLLAKKMKK